MHKTRPVTFNIPAGQPIETTSISSFKGIQYSDNPLNVDPDSASDMLNVYLNDSGTLTTRPRIEFENKLFPQAEKIIRAEMISDNRFVCSLREAGENNIKLYYVEMYPNINAYDIYPIDFNETGSTINYYNFCVFDDPKNSGRFYLCSEKKFYLGYRDYNRVVLIDVKVGMGNYHSYIPVVEIDGEKTPYENNLLSNKIQKKYS